MFFPKPSNDHVTRTRHPFAGTPELPAIPLPKGWSQYTLLAVLHVITLARIIVLNVANWPSDAECDGLKLRCENDRLRGEIDLLQREIDIKDARFARIETKKRPAYSATERFEILAIKAMRGWSNEKIAKRFQISERSIRRWFRGSETQSGITQMPEIVSRYPDYVRNIVRRLKGCCPMLGRTKSRKFCVGLDGKRRLHKEPNCCRYCFGNGAGYCRKWSFAKTHHLRSRHAILLHENSWLVRSP